AAGVRRPAAPRAAGVIRFLASFAALLAVALLAVAIYGHLPWVRRDGAAAAAVAPSPAGAPPPAPPGVDPRAARARALAAELERMRSGAPPLTFASLPAVWDRLARLRA